MPAGAMEVAGPLRQLTPHISTGIGFTAIIVCFVGRLHPLGIVFAGIETADGRPLAEIGGNAYRLEAMRTLTTTAIDLGHKPAVLTAIAKYHMTELARRSLAHAMDIHAGRAIQCGPLNYLAHQYMGIPIAITVEGANILTRSLMIFGQGASRCHPFILAEMAAAADVDSDRGLQAFDRLLLGHLRYTLGNFGRALWLGWSGCRYYRPPVSGETAPYYGQLVRMSALLALLADVAQFNVQGDQLTLTNGQGTPSTWQAVAKGGSQP